MTLIKANITALERAVTRRGTATYRSHLVTLYAQFYGARTLARATPRQWARARRRVMAAYPGAVPPWGGGSLNNALMQRVALDLYDTSAPTHPIYFPL